MDLDDSELYWTRKQKGLATEKETEEYIRSLEEKIKELENTNKKLYELCQGKAMQEFINNECDYIPKSKVKELGEQVHSKLDNNAIIRGYQIIIDEMFSKLLEKGE